jgi:hypothetical protein
VVRSSAYAETLAKQVARIVSGKRNNCRETLA